MVRALGWRSKSRGFESRRQELKKNFEFYRVKKVVLTRCRCGGAHGRTYVKDPIAHVIFSSVGDGNTTITDNRSTKVLELNQNTQEVKKNAI